MASYRIICFSVLVFCRNFRDFQCFPSLQSWCPGEGLNLHPENQDQPLIKKALNIAEKMPKYCFFFDTGTGKTISALEVIKQKQCKGLIVAPLSTLKTVWEDSIDEFYPDMKYINLYPFNKPKREAFIRNDNSVHIINPDGFKIHFETIMKANYKCLILDESSCLKGRTTKIAKTLIKFGQSIESSYLLSGTPAPNTKMEFFPQLYLIAPGLLGFNFYSFRNRYFHPVDRNGYKWVENSSMQEDFIERLQKYCLFVKKSDVLDLPERTYEVREVIMSTEQSKIYKQMKKEFVAEIKGETIMSPNVLSKIMKLRQITSGFVYYNDSTLKISDRKIKALHEVLEEIGNNQVIIWANFKAEIKELLKNIPNSVAIYGDIANQTLKDNNLSMFKQGQYQYLIANPASLAHGVTIVNASYAIYYSLSYSNEQWQQSQDRIYRYGQKNKCTYIILNCKDTIDEVLYRTLQRKEKDYKEVLEYLKGGKQDEILESSK
ncbi:MAG TPA: DEAD/DEAH box helicase [Candidatus Pacearchaeota archaeon]|nr:DEAD/DEAH box helicase [Candidatus Pacearchaeota archaeon]